MKKLSFFFLCILQSFAVSSQQFIWAKHFGSSNTQQIHDLATDPSGNVYITGTFESLVDFDPGPGTFTMISTGTLSPQGTTNAVDTYLSKFDAAGNFIWARQISGLKPEHAFKIIPDNSGNVYITGIFSGTADFDPGASTFNLTGNGTGGNTSFIWKLDGNGNFLWAKEMGGTAGNIGLTALALDPSGSLVLSGTYFGTADFDPGAGTNNSTAMGGSDMYVCKLDALGNFLWVKTNPTSSAEVVLDMGLDATGNIYLTGEYTGTVDFDSGPAVSNLTSAGMEDVFVLKLDGSANFLWARSLGGNNVEHAWGIAIAPNGNVYTSGTFSSTTADFDPGVGTDLLNLSGMHDIFISKLDASGNHLWAKSIGSSLYEFPRDITLDASGNLHMVGSFDGVVDFDPGPAVASFSSSVQPMNPGEGFVLILSSSGNYLWAGQLDGAYGTGEIKLNTSGEIYIGGSINNPCDLDPGPASFLVPASNDIFVLKLSTFDPNNFTGIGTELEIKPKVVTYPNPTNGSITILSDGLGEEKYFISDITGKKLLEGKLESSTVIDMKSLPSGLYLIRAGSQTYKIVKE